MKNKRFFVYTFYRFIKIKNKKEIKNSLDTFLSNKLVRGTILLADEGINGSISANKNDLISIIRTLKRLLKIKKLEIKITKTDYLPFNRMKVRIKKEIVSLGIENVEINSQNINFISPSKWNKILKDGNTKIIDVRNKFEIEIGTFENSINPETDSFREFPEKLKKLEIDKNERIAIFCTGGIRCEKASAFLKKDGYKNVVQLDGGIINYLNYKRKSKTKSMWKGECFVFDNRVTLDKDLLSGNYLQCHGCRRPITSEDANSKYYKKGIYCPYCFSKRSIKQKKSSQMRHEQIIIANTKKIDHAFKKIYR